MTNNTQAVEAAEREKFEAWFLREKKGTLHDLRMEGEWYYFLSTAKLWDAWTARAALTSQQEVSAEVGITAIKLVPIRQLFDEIGNQVCDTGDVTCHFYVSFQSGYWCNHCQRGIHDNKPHRLCPVIHESRK